MTIATAPGSKSTIPTTTAPSLLPVGAEPGDDWTLARRKGNQVRYRNNRNAAWDKKFSFEPGDVLYREPLGDIVTVKAEGVTITSEPEVAQDGRGITARERVALEAKYGSETVAELKDRAKLNGVKGYSKLRKDELVAAIIDAQIGG